MSVTHPVDRGDEGRGAFDHAAEAASNFTSSPTFFVLSVLVIAAWAVGYVAGFSDLYHHVSADLMAALTLALVALLKNAERRSEHAVQRKLDLIAAALIAEDEGETRKARERLREAVGLHDEV